jgi:transcriptional regulator with XRE-family HTH domain
MRQKKQHNAIDEHVGSRLRARRKALKMNQGALAQELGLTFQMVQRYEHGLCRMSASTLYRVAVLLDVPVSYFFDGLRQSPEGGIAPARVDALSLELARTRDGRTVAAMFPRIGDRDVRSAIAGLVRAMATSGVAEPETV